jgi:putative membrane protein insertion efficiency factor
MKWRSFIFPTLFILLLIRLYQKTLSPDHGPLKRFFPNGYCRFHPTCSEYARKSFEKHGFFNGLFLTAKRITRCNPWNQGGIDEVPVKK